MDLGSQTVLKKLPDDRCEHPLPHRGPEPAGRAEAGPAGELRRGGEARMKEEVSGMGRPNSRAELCAWVLGLMGAFFLLFGGAVLLWDIPVGGAGPDWAFLPIGAALLAAGGGCALACLARRRSPGAAAAGGHGGLRHRPLGPPPHLRDLEHPVLCQCPGPELALERGVRVHLGRPGLYRVHRPAVGGAPGGGGGPRLAGPGPAGAGLCGPGFCPAGPYGIRGGGGPAPSRDLYSDYYDQKRPAGAEL